MKKTFIALSAIVLAAFFGEGKAQAENVSADKARAVAGAVLGGNSYTRAASASELKLVWDGLEPGTRGMMEEPPFYIFSRDGGGFVMVSGDTGADPVLAYSDNGYFSPEGMPENVRYWFGQYKEYVETVRQNKAGNLANELEWEALLSSGTFRQATENKKILETAEWNQGHPYNHYSPNNGVTGCVATAMAIVLRYHRWPDRGVGHIDDYTYQDSYNDGKAVKVQGHDLGHEYDWDNMPLKPTKSDQKVKEEGKLAATDEIARLMYDCGTMVQAMYSSEGTGAYSTDVLPALKEHMKIDHSARWRYANYHELEEWRRLLIAEIDADRPVIYSAQSEDGGHEFVVDGYDARDFLHVNWGWGGNGNGFFDLPDFNGFTIFPDALFGVAPDHGGKEQEIVMMYNLDDYYSMTDGTREFRDNDSVFVQCTLYNYGYDYHGRLAWAKFNRAGEFEEFVSDTVESRVDDWPFDYTVRVAVECYITTPIKFGDHLKMYYYGDNNGEWRLAEERKGRNCTVDLADPYSIEEITSVRYEMATKSFIVRTKPDAEWRLEDANGIAVKDGISADFPDQTIDEDDRQIISFDLNVIPKGQYTLILSKGKDVKELKLTF